MLLISLCQGCRREADPRVFKARDIESYVPDHIKAEDFIVTGSELKPEYFDPYYTQDSDYIAAVGDVLEVSIFGHDDTVIDRVSVAPDGRIYYMFIDGVPAAGRSLSDINVDVTEEVGRYFVNPEVDVIPRSISGRSFRIMGKVVQPGVYPLTTAITLRQAIGTAGGIRWGGFAGTTINVANLRESFLVRNGERLAIDFEKLLYTEGSDQNIFIQPGDYVYVASSLVQEVFLLGAVREQKPIPYKDGLTLVSMMSGVTGIQGGVLPTANQQQVTVVRGSMDNPQVITANLIKILEGRARDVYLLPGDIVYVPEKTFRFGRELVRQAFNSFVSAFGASAGNHYGEDHWFLDETLNNTTENN
jgi:protein involved in polysaccharide export with SLBB domain